MKARGPGGPAAVRAGAPRAFRIAVEFILVAACTLVFAGNLAGIATSLLTDRYAGQRDFLTYWSSARQLVLHANPYDPVAIGVMERAVGYSASLPTLVMRNPPYSLPFVYPLGFLSLRTASLVWSAWMLAAAWVSILLIRSIYRRGRSRIDLFGFLFAPLLSCFIAGQTAVFALLGLALFLKFHQTRPAVAGAALWLCALKPQNFAVFGVVLVLWCVASRRWRLPLAAIATLAASALLATIAWPGVWHEYRQMMASAHIEDQLIPCLSTMLRLLIRPGALWLQWVPLVVGCCWAVIYFLRQRAWDWRAHGGLLILISVTVAPYTWFMDQTLFLAALLPLLYRRSSDRRVVASFVLLSAALAAANLAGIPLGSLWLYPWTACAWLIWYLWAGEGKTIAEDSHLRGAVEVTRVP